MFTRQGWSAEVLGDNGVSYESMRRSGLQTEVLNLYRRYLSTPTTQQDPDHWPTEPSASPAPNPRKPAKSSSSSSAPHCVQQHPPYPIHGISTLSSTSCVGLVDLSRVGRIRTLGIVLWARGRGLSVPGGDTRVNSSFNE